MPISIAALYQFAPFDDPAALRPDLQAVCAAGGVRGTLILASEGINGTIAGEPAGVKAVLAHIRALPGCAPLDVKFSEAERLPFGRLKIRIKREIVTLGVVGVDAAREAGTRVDPRDWNRLIDDPGTLVIDTRNDYEVAIGSFRGAISPDTRSFTEFPAWVEAHRDELAQAERIAMFCTGGIRCEKSTALLRQAGFRDVFHLRGGILGYLEAIPEAESRWQGECFVFDERVSVGHNLAPGAHRMCPACGWPAKPLTPCAHCGSTA